MVFAVYMNMNAIMYKKAQSYAYKCRPDEYKDLVHDAWVVWWDKKGEDLFDQDERLVMRVLKYIVLSRSQKDYFVENGERHHKLFINVEKLTGTSYDSEFNTKTLKSLQNSPLLLETTPETILADKDELEVIRKSLTDKQKSVFDLLAEGLERKQIDMSQQLCNYYVSQIRKKRFN